MLYEDFSKIEGVHRYAQGKTPKLIGPVSSSSNGGDPFGRIVEMLISSRVLIILPCAGRGMNEEMWERRVVYLEII